MRLSTRRVSVRIRRFFHAGNLARVIVSLVLAFTLWAWVTAENDPEVDRVFTSIPITAQHLPAQFQIVGPLPAVDVRLQGPRSELDKLDPARIKATLDFSGVKDVGTVTMSVDADAPGDLRVRGVFPARVTLTVGQAGADTPRRSAADAPPG